MDEETVRSLYLRYAEHSRTDPERAHAVYHPDAEAREPPEWRARWRAAPPRTGA